MHQPSDTNSAQKVCRILRVLSSPEPLRLADITLRSGLNKASTLRLLDTLIAEGFVARDEPGKRYRLGDEALVLGMAMQGRDHIRERARPALVRLAALSGDTVLLSTRHGLESVCVDREFGTFPIRANYLEIGSRRPLGAGAGSLALLAWLPDEEIATVLALLEPVLARRYPRITRELLAAEIAASRQRGYATLLDVVVDQMGGVGVPILGGDGKPVAALSIAALTQRVASRLTLLVPALQQAAAALSARRAAAERRMSFLIGSGLTRYGRHEGAVTLDLMTAGDRPRAGRRRPGARRHRRPGLRLLDDASAPDARHRLRRALRAATRRTRTACRSAARPAWRWSCWRGCSSPRAPAGACSSSAARTA